MGIPCPPTGSFKPPHPRRGAMGGFPPPTSAPPRASRPGAAAPSPAPPAPAAAPRSLPGRAPALARRRFERGFAGGRATAVRDAVAAYRNPDGGFGHGLEPDCRAPGSQPATTALALRTLDEAEAWDDDLVRGACDHLEATAPPEGGAVFVDESIAGWPAAPWWQPGGRSASMVTTGPLAGALHARGVRHPWLDRATAWLWTAIDEPGELGAYDAIGAMRFLDHVPEPERAAAAAERIAALLAEQGLIELDPEAPGEVHGPLSFAGRPGSPSRAAFAEDAVAAHLGHLAAGQQPDGAWTFNWPAWSPAAEADWRGSLTVDALLRLRAEGRLAA